MTKKSKNNERVRKQLLEAMPTHLMELVNLDMAKMQQPVPINQ